MVLRSTSITLVGMRLRPWSDDVISPDSDGSYSPAAVTKPTGSGVEIRGFFNLFLLNSTSIP